MVEELTSKKLGKLKGSITASCNACLALSSPATSLHFTLGFSLIITESRPALSLSLSFSCYEWFWNTVEELEPLRLEVLRKYIRLSVWAIGPILPQAMISSPTKSMIHILSAKKFWKKCLFFGRTKHRMVGLALGGFSSKTQLVLPKWSCNLLLLWKRVECHSFGSLGHLLVLT